MKDFCDKVLKLQFDLSLLSFYRLELMGISAIGILLCHASGRGVVMPVVVERVLAVGNIGVDIFLLLSGIGMYYSLSREGVSIWHWYLKDFSELECRIS